MNTEEIFELMISDKEISKIFMGVYSIDLIPQDLPTPSIIIVNLDSSEKKGSHWIVLHYQRKYVEYFDSLGKQPKKMIHNLLTSKGFTYKYNKKVTITIYRLMWIVLLLLQLLQLQKYRLQYNINKL